LDCDPGKLASAARLRSETTLPIKRIAARVQIGTAKGAKSVLPHLAQNQDQRKIASALEPCAQLEFQSTVFHGLFSVKVSPASLGLAGRGHGRYLGKHEHTR
jgi:hypothetical protein